jgi:hypothetical protein
MSNLRHPSAKVKYLLVQALYELAAMGLFFHPDGTRLSHEAHSFNKLAEANVKRLTDLLMILHEYHGQAVSLLGKKGENS